LSPSDQEALFFLSVKEILEKVARVACLYFAFLAPLAFLAGSMLHSTPLAIGVWLVGCMAASHGLFADESRGSSLWVARTVVETSQEKPQQNFPQEVGPVLMEPQIERVDVSCQVNLPDPEEVILFNVDARDLENGSLIPPVDASDSSGSHWTWLQDLGASKVDAELNSDSYVLVPMDVTQVVEGVMHFLTEEKIPVSTDFQSKLTEALQSEGQEGPLESDGSWEVLSNSSGQQSGPVLQAVSNDTSSMSWDTVLELSDGDEVKRRRQLLEALGKVGVTLTPEQELHLWKSLLKYRQQDQEQLLVELAQDIDQSNQSLSVEGYDPSTWLQRYRDNAPEALKEALFTTCRAVREGYYVRGGFYLVPDPRSMGQGSSSGPTILLGWDPGERCFLGSEAVSFLLRSNLLAGIDEKKEDLMQSVPITFIRGSLTEGLPFQEPNSEFNVRIVSIEKLKDRAFWQGLRSQKTKYHYPADFSKDPAIAQGLAAATLQSHWAENPLVVTLQPICGCFPGHCQKECHLLPHSDQEVKTLFREWMNDEWCVNQVIRPLIVQEGTLKVQVHRFGAILEEVSYPLAKCELRVRKESYDNFRKVVPRGVSMFREPVEQLPEGALCGVPYFWYLRKTEEEIDDWDMI
jgi:hypothetical protein